MMDMIKPVRFGILAGLIGLVFGIGWAFFLTLGEQRVAKNLETAMKQDVAQKDVIMRVSRERLGMGHSHAMGLGLVTITVSLLLSLTSAPHKLKAAGSLLSGLGGLLFPVAWIIMGCRTPAQGIDGAHDAVTPMAAISVVLILSGTFVTTAFLLRDAFKTE